MIIRAARRRPWTWLAVTGIVAAVALRGWLPRLAAFMPSCLLRRWTGWNCPGCGGTRCSLRLLDGNVSGALAANPMVVACYFLAALWLAAAVVAEWRGRPAPVPSARTGRALAVGVIVFAFTRNLPWWPFTLLAPR